MEARESALRCFAPVKEPHSMAALKGLGCHQILAAVHQLRFLISTIFHPIQVKTLTLQRQLRRDRIVHLGHNQSI